LGIGDWAQSPIPNPQSPINYLSNIKQILKHLEVTEKQMVKHNLNNIFIYYINIL